MSDRDPHKLKTYAVIIYVLFAIPGGLLSLIGVILAYLKLNMGGPGPNSHFVFQIRTFWIGILLAVLGLVVWPLGLAKTVWFLAALWFLARSVIGLVKALGNQAIPSPRSWFLGL
ncbi:DUF4870 family protein [Euryhalocaulis caribicus]|uniref:DUF4870 family protein n=1 Tax=Euryhalocaulis caribicus TaxID=1161401 RepID=UPI0003A2A578|nr:membrane protein [Euryhalocaulis caribicus]